MDAKADLELTGVLVWGTAVAGPTLAGPQPVAKLSDLYYDFCDENDHVGQIDSVIGFGRRVAKIGWPSYRSATGRGYVVPRRYWPDVNLWTPTMRLLGAQVGRMAPAEWGVMDAYRQYAEWVQVERGLELSLPMFLTSIGVLFPEVIEVRGSTILRRPT